MSKEVKKIGIRIIFAWILSFLFIIVGTFWLFSLAIFSGILYVLAGLIILPPLNKFVKEKYKLEFSVWLKILLILILLVVAGLSLPDDALSDYSYTGSSINTGNVVGQEIESEGTSNIQTQETNEPEIYSFGDKVIIDNFAYTFHDYEIMNEIGGSEYFEGELADGIFLVFDVTIENIAKESKTLWSSYVTVIDGEGRRFENDVIAEIYLDASFSFEQIQPGLPKRGKIVFDVPQDIKGFIEVSSDNIWSDEVKYVSWAD